MNCIHLAVLWLLSYVAYFVEADIMFETEKFMPNEPSTIRSCTQRHKNLHIFDSLRDLSVCERLATDCRAVSPVAGVPSRIAEFPHIAAIGWLQSDNTTLWDCGGILITESFVMTAGHCTYSKRFESAPKFVRLGELRVENEVQFFGIERIIKHPNYKFTSNYDDLALIKLDGKAKTGVYILPACLWPTHSFNFDKMDAAGWGLDQTGGERVEVLTKVTLSAVPNAECSKFYPKRRKLKTGLKDTQLCAGDPVMDTCQGDSGGPLEIKLYAKSKLIPFVVGITSFGTACGTNIPGVYTRVSSYIPWLESVVNETFDPLRCSIRNIADRIYDPVDYVDKSDLVSSVAIINDNEPSVKCGGSVIDSQYVLTSASCFTQMLPGPKVVRFDNGEKVEVALTSVHPMKNEFYNDLVLVKLANKIRIRNMTQIICPAPFHLEPNNYRTFQFSSDTIDHYLAQSSGPQLFYNNFEDSSDLSKLDFHTSQIINIRSRLVPTANCSELIKKISNITEIDGSTQICAGNVRFAVPGVCQSVAGGPWILEGLPEQTNGYTIRIPYLVGVQSFGVDCGFGIPAVASNVTSFIPWIDSVLYSERKPVGTDLKVADDFEKCTSTNFVRTNKSEPGFYQEALFESSVLIGRYSAETFDIQWQCDGVILSEKIILTTARCVKSIGNSKIQVMTAPLSTQTLHEANQYHIHPDYSAASGQNDIALIVIDPLEFNESTVAACLWYNTTHLPFQLRKVVFDRSEPISAAALDMNPVQSEDCAEHFGMTGNIAGSEFCTAVDVEENILECLSHRKKILSNALCSTSCDRHHGETILHFTSQQGKVSTVVVGLASASNFCDMDKPLVFTRLSAYREWIETFMQI